MSVQQLNQLVTEMSVLELRKRELEDELASVKDRLKLYQTNLVPTAMDEMMADEIKTRTGLRVVVRDQVFASFPKDREKRAEAFKYLEETGNDGLVKNEISIKYGRDSHEMAKRVMSMLHEMGVDSEARVDQKPSVHPQSLRKFLRQELERGANVPMEAFGAFVQRVAEIKFK